MATFAPETPQVNPPDWTNLFKPITQPEANKSLGITLATAGQAIDSGAEIADRAEKDDLKNKVETGVNSLRDAYTDSLTAVRNQQIAQSDPNQQSLVTPSAANVPQGIQNGVAKLQGLAAAQAQGGSKVNDTLYTGAVNALAKQLRNQYPGYKDYIDQQIKSVSGMDPANAFYKNLIQDINAHNDNQKTEANATRGMLREMIKGGVVDHGGTSAASVLAAYDAGHLSIDQVNKWVNQTNSLDYLIKQKATLRADQQGDQADAKVSATKDLSQTVGTAVSNAWTTMSIGKNTDTPQKLVAFLQSHAGKGDVTDEQATAIGQQLVAMRQKLFQSGMAIANQGGPNSIVSKLGGDPTEAAKIVNGQLSTLDMAISDVYNKDWGSAYSHMNFNKAIKSDTTNMLYNAPDEETRKYNRAVGAINEISPQYAKDFFQQALVSDVPQREKEWLKRTKMNMLVPDENGSITYIQNALDEGKRLGGGAQSPKTWHDLINFSSNLSNPKIADSQRYNIAQGFFNPEHNGNLLSDDNFKRDGKYSVWNQLTSQQVAAGVQELGKTHPDVLKMYHDFGEHQFGEQLFSRELLDLRDAAMDPNTFKIKYVDMPGQPPRFEVTNPDGSPITTPIRGRGMDNLPYKGGVQQVVNRLNMGMTGLYNVYKTSGSQNPNADILSTMHTYGFASPQEQAPGMVRKLWNAIAASQQDTLETIAKRKANFQEEK